MNVFFIWIFNFILQFSHSITSFTYIQRRENSTDLGRVTKASKWEKEFIYSVKAGRVIEKIK